MYCKCCAAYICSMLGGTDEDLALCLQAEEDRRAQRLRQAHTVSENLARQLERGENRKTSPQVSASRPSAADTARQVDEDERLARQLAQQAAEPPAPPPPPQRGGKVSLLSCDALVLHPFS